MSLVSRDAVYSRLRKLKFHREMFNFLGAYRERTFILEFLEKVGVGEQGKNGI